MGLRKLFALHKFTPSLLFLNQHFRVSTCGPNLYVIYKMNEIYFQNNKNDSSCSINFTFSNNEFNISKQIQLKRNISESICISLQRLKSKIHSALESKAKKLSKKDQSFNVVIPEFQPYFVADDKVLSDSTLLQEIFEEKFNNLKLKLLDKEYIVVINVPIVKSLIITKDICVGCPVCPEKFETACALKEKCVFTWHRSLHKNIKGNWVQCGTGYFYTPVIEDQNYFLKLSCLPRNEKKTGPVFETISSEFVKNFDFNIEIIKRHEFTKHKTADDEFRIVTYNILADTYTNTKEAKSSLFTYCDPDILQFHFRKNLWNFELLGYNADLICLQEVDRKVFKFNFQPLFSEKNYGCIYHEKEGFREGCVLLFDNRKFNLLNTERYVYSKDILNNNVLSYFKEKIINNEKLIQRLDNIQSQIQISVLKCLKSEKDIIVVGNTHMYFHPDSDHIRLLQGLVGFKLLQNTAENLQKQYPEKQISIILCGDFNSTPDCGFHQFLNEGFVGPDHIDWKSNESEAIKNISLNHSLNMKSAYETPAFTNYTKLFKACLDYIYYQSDYLSLKQIVPIPPEEVLSQQTAIPSYYFPSDHVALIADLKFKK